MWKTINGKLIQTTDISRVKFRTNISKTILDELMLLGENHDTHVNYLLESGLEKLLDNGYITYNKDARPKDRIQYKTTYDQDLLNGVKEFAKKHKLFINDVIEHSVNFIDFNNVKDKNHKSRIEKGVVS